MENGPFISDVPIKISIQKGFSIAMFGYQKVSVNFFTLRIRCFNPNCLGCTATSPVGDRCPRARTTVGRSELDAPERHISVTMGELGEVLGVWTERNQTSQNLRYVYLSSNSHSPGEKV